MSRDNNTEDTIGDHNAEKWARKWNFDLAKYGVIASLDIEGWAEQLSERAWLKRLAAGDIGGINQEAVAKNIRNTLRTAFKTTPILDLDFRPRAHATSVHALTMSDAFDIANSYQGLVTTLENSKRAQSLFAENPMPYDVVEWESPKHQGRKLAHIVIDLTAAESKIQIDAMQCIRHLRMQYEKRFDPKSAAKRANSENTRLPLSLPNVPYNDKDSKRWHKYGVIPYIDLTLAAKLDGKTIEAPAMAALIFPRENKRDPIDLVRTSTKFYAEQLLTPLVLDALNGQTKLSKQ